jgi:hypothetical protein
MFNITQSPYTSATPCTGEPSTAIKSHSRFQQSIADLIKHIRGHFPSDGGFPVHQFSRLHIISISQVADKLPGAGNDFSPRIPKFSTKKLVNPTAVDIF